LNCKFPRETLWVCTAWIRVKRGTWGRIP
jgi:hypothetical protein